MSFNKAVLVWSDRLAKLCIIQAAELNLMYSTKQLNADKHNKLRFGGVYYRQAECITGARERVQR